ncbi:MAG: macro domain-containing protein [candidate division Zixibacteria bacterium]|nr:macro domain-containing protein [candidate division Zixibacteria bacterium]
MQKESQKIKIRLIQGDITEQEVDAVVNAANNHLWMGAGVAGAIKRKGGVEIEEEAMSKGPIPVSEAVVTKAGNLKAKYVIHAAVMGQDLITNEEYIRNATLNSLKRAEELKIESIAFPAFGTGVGGFSADECARIMLGEIKDFSKKAKHLEEVRFVLFDKENYDIWSIKPR